MLGAENIPQFANVPYSLKMIVHEADMIIANYDGTRLGKTNQVLHKCEKLKMKKKKKDPK